MMINERLTETQFARLGFCLAYLHRDTGEMLFSRPCYAYPDLFEYVKIHLAGRRLQTVSADVGISCIRGRFSWRGLADRFCVLDVASNKERGQSDLAGPRDFELWLNHLIKVLDSQTTHAREKFASGVAQRTQEARMASHRYLKTIGFPCSIEAVCEKLSSKASETQCVDANLILSHQIGWLANPKYHFAAVLAVYCLSGEVEPGLRFDFHDPSVDTPLMWRVQIIADHLMAYPKQRTLIFPKNAGLNYLFREPLMPCKEIQ